MNIFIVHLDTNSQSNSRFEKPQRYSYDAWCWGYKRSNWTKLSARFFVEFFQKRTGNVIYLLFYFMFYWFTSHLCIVLSTFFCMCPKWLISSTVITSAVYFTKTTSRNGVQTNLSTTSLQILTYVAFDMCFLCKDITIVSYCWATCTLVFPWDRVARAMAIFPDSENVLSRAPQLCIWPKHTM